MLRSHLRTRAFHGTGLVFGGVVAKGEVDCEVGDGEPVEDVGEGEPVAGEA